MCWHHGWCHCWSGLVFSCPCHGCPSAQRSLLGQLPLQVCNLVQKCMVVPAGSPAVWASHLASCLNLCRCLQTTLHAMEAGPRIPPEKWTVTTQVCEVRSPCLGGRFQPARALAMLWEGRASQAGAASPKALLGKCVLGPEACHLLLLPPPWLPVLMHKCSCLSWAANQRQLAKAT